MHDNRYLIFLSQYHGLVLPNTRIRVAVSPHGRFRLTQPSTPSRVSLDKAFNGNFLPTLRNAKLAGTLVLQPQADVQLFSVSAFLVSSEIARLFRFSTKFFKASNFGQFSPPLNGGVCSVPDQYVCCILKAPI